jgi:hypothetical protein
MQARLGGPGRDPERDRNLGQRQTKEVVEHDDRSMIDIEAPQSLVEELAVGDVGGWVGWTGQVEHVELDLDRPSLAAADEVQARSHGQSMKPGVEPSGIAQTRQIAPGLDQGLLDRVSRELAIPEDESGNRVQPRDGRVDELREGVMIARPRSLDETSLVHGRLGCGTAVMVVLDSLWRRASPNGSAAPV